MSNIPLQTVLLIEDDPGDALLIQEILEQQHCLARLVVAERLAAGIDHLQDGIFDAVLLDMNLPDSRGLATLTHLIDVAPAMPIVILTGNTDESDAIEALRLGAQDYLVKGAIDGAILKRSIYYAVERKKLEKALQEMKDRFERQARIDYLTGVYNRLMFSELLESEVRRAKRSGNSMSIFMCDLDYFKKVNDVYGHTVGDQVLKEIAQLIASNIRAQDILARWGGEEFLVLVPDCNLNQAVSLAERLRGLCETHDFGKGLQLTASFGVTQFRAEDNTQSVLERVDAALYSAKRNGRNRVEPSDHLSQALAKKHTTV